MQVARGTRRAGFRRALPTFEALEARLALAAVVALDINDTVATTDDITVFNPATSAQPFIQTVPMRVTNNGPAAKLTLVVMPAGAVTFSVNTVTLAPKAVMEVTITPAMVSKTVDDITIEVMAGKKVEGSQKLTDVSVILPPKIRNSDTPAAMTADRIPPRVDSTFTVMVTPDLGASGKVVTLAATGQSDNNGKLTIGGAATLDVTKTGDVALRGTTQTAATGGDGGGNAGNLKLVARVRAQDTAKSSGFSVAAIPQNFTITFDSLIDDGTFFGIKVADKWESDSGVVADLDAAHLSEQVEPGVGTGVFLGFKSDNSGYLSATEFSKDSHSTPIARYVKAPGGTVTIMQVSIFLDKRTGAKDIPATKSGYTVTRTVFKDPANAAKWKLQTVKQGAKTKANGYASDAGAGGPVDKTQP